MHWIAFMSSSDCELNVMMQKIQTYGKIQVKHSYLISVYEKYKKNRKIAFNWNQKCFLFNGLFRSKQKKSQNLDISFG